LDFVSFWNRDRFNVVSETVAQGRFAKQACASPTIATAERSKGVGETERAEGFEYTKIEELWAENGVAVVRPVERMRMGQLFDRIRQLVAEEKYVVGQHASERLEERGIMEWQVVAGLEDGELIAERPDATPNPVVEVRESLPDGTEFKAVWSHLRQSGVAKLVTVHFFDRG
jgi:hypothetical protein